MGRDRKLYVCKASRGPGPSFPLTGAVLRYDSDTGAFEDEFVPNGRGGMNSPIDLLFGSAGNLYVSDHHTHRVLRYTGATGAFVDAFIGTRSGGLDNPAGLTFGPDGNLYVCSLNTNQILRYDGTTGTFKDAFVTGGFTLPARLILTMWPLRSVVMSPLAIDWMTSR